ncbi:hypothetical protein EVAR_70537_1, partial [Eumeta japonica]
MASPRTRRILQELKPKDENSMRHRRLHPTVVQVVFLLLTTIHQPIIPKIVETISILLAWDIKMVADITMLVDINNSIHRSLKIRKKSFLTNLPPSQGGKYSGFGYSRNPPPKTQSQELIDTTLSSLAS